MTETAALLSLLALVAVALSWAVPAALALDAVALWTAGVLATLAPASALWLLGAAALTPMVLQVAERGSSRDLVAAAWSTVLLAAFVAARLSPGILWIGGAYFTLRALHVVGDWWMGRLPAPAVRAHLRYQLFLPVIVAGPIHRFETFERQAQRRRWDASSFFAGLERALLGTVSAVVVGGWLVGRVGDAVGAATTTWNPFVHAWVASVFNWIALYFVFSGLTSVALGLSLMAGLTLEENFNRPWAARNLIEFWLRWHMSLTRWCRDYVFRPVAAFTRSALAGLVLAMLAVGLWHAFSAYYVLWSVWQATGIVVTRLALRWLPFDRMPLTLRAVLGPVFVLGWLSLARPLLTDVLRLGL